MKDKLGSLAIIVLASELSFSSCFGVLIQSRNKKLKNAFYLFVYCCNHCRQMLT